jgi:hypothetical protein
MLRKWLLIIIILCTLGFVSANVVAKAAPAFVDTVQVEVQAEGHLPLLIQRRMEASVHTIAEQVLTGHNVNEAMLKRMEYEQLIREVFNRILIGYTVSAVQIAPGSDTQVTVKLVPWDDVIKKIDTTVQVEGMPREIAALALQDVAGVENLFEQNMLGLPIDAADWTNGILKSSLNVFMQEHLPEFRADFDVEPGTVTKVKIVLYPKVPVVRNVDLAMRSESMPNILLLNYRPQIQKKADIMLGVPVDFVKRHNAYFNQVLVTSLDEQKDFRSFHVKTHIELNPGEKTYVKSYSDTARYRFTLEGYFDINSKADNTTFRIHLGRFISSHDEVFTELDFYPQSVTWKAFYGYERELLPTVKMGMKYDSNAHNGVFLLKKKFDNKWLLRYEYAFADQTEELGLRYKIHDFVSLEYIIDDKDSWLRLIGNF